MEAGSEPSSRQHALLTRLTRILSHSFSSARDYISLVVLRRCRFFLRQQTGFAGLLVLNASKFAPRVHHIHYSRLSLLYEEPR